MVTDWASARRLEELAEREQLPWYARKAMSEAAQLIRELDEELYVRNVLITRLLDGQEHPGPGGLAEIRAAYWLEFKQAARAKTMVQSGIDQRGSV